MSLLLVDWQEQAMLNLTTLASYRMMRRMDVERTIAEIEWLEDIASLPDTRPLSASDIAAANRRHDEALSHSPWFRLWQSYGVCCRPADPGLALPESGS